LVFFDCILIFSPSWAEHLWHVQLILTTLQEHHPFVKRLKCSFDTRTMVYIGHIFSEEGVAMDEQKVHVVVDWPVPQKVHVVRMFLGLVGYYRRFICDYDDIVTPLIKLLRKVGILWTSEEEALFRALQQALTRAPVLQLLTFD
jgi:hypothetical protein